MKLLSTIALSAAIAIIGAGAGFAQTPATTTPGTAATKTPAAKPTSVEKTAISKACSEQADAKNLHGKERKKFRAKCKRSGGKPS
jgi:hypothetical protein